MKPRQYKTPGERERHLFAIRTSSKARLYQRSILLQMLFASDFKSATVAITKKQIEIEQLCDRKTVQRAWDFLKKEGTIVPIYNKLGGRGNATTFALCAIGDQEAEQEPQQDDKSRSSKAHSHRFQELSREGYDYGTIRHMMEKEGYTFD